GSRLQTPSLLASGGPGAIEAAERVLPRERLHDLPGRLGRVPDRRPRQLAPAALGQRLPAQRFAVAELAAGAGGADEDLASGADARDHVGERRRALRDRRRGAGLAISALGARPRAPPRRRPSSPPCTGGTAGTRPPARA